MSKRINTVSMVISAFLCALLGATGKLNGSFEISQTYMLLYLCKVDEVVAWLMRNRHLDKGV